MSDTPSREDAGAEYTGRGASFYCPVEDEMDVEAVAQRVAQFVAVGWQRDELDGVKIQMREVQDNQAGNNTEGQ